MPTHNQIDLVEFPAADQTVLADARAFYETVFDWGFTDYGAYLDTSDSGTVAGINAVPDDQKQSMPLVVIYVDDLEAAKQKVTDAGAPCSTTSTRSRVVGASTSSTRRATNSPSGRSSRSGPRPGASAPGSIQTNRTACCRRVRMSKISLPPTDRAPGTP